MQLSITNDLIFFYNQMTRNVEVSSAGMTYIIADVFRMQMCGDKKKLLH